MQRCLSLVFQEREVEKRYVAVVAGKLETETGEVNLPIAADWPNRPLQRIDAEQGKPSLTRYRRWASMLDDTRVELEPVTGRTHQLRVHMKAIGHPILGDALYGDAASAPRLKLHAAMLKSVASGNPRALAFCRCTPILGAGFKVTDSHLIYNRSRFSFIYRTSSWRCRKAF